MFFLLPSLGPLDNVTSNQFLGLPVEAKRHDMHVSTSVIPVVGKRAPVLCELSVAHGHLPRRPGADKMSGHYKGADLGMFCQEKSQDISTPPAYLSNGSHSLSSQGNRAGACYALCVGWGGVGILTKSFSYSERLLLPFCVSVAQRFL